MLGEIRWGKWMFVATLLLMVNGVLAQKQQAPIAIQTIKYNRDIRPILSENCFFCHGPDKNKRQAGLRLDIRSEAVARFAIVAGKPEKSRLLQRVNTNQTALLMPPPSSHKKLNQEQKRLLSRWITQGAPYEAHWSYAPLTRPSVPKTVLQGFPQRNEIDAFIHAKLREKKLLPSREAERTMLVRRVFLDLTGLPPTSDEVKSANSDASPNWYEKLVDRLLASPHYGERMAVPWLDLARYADTVGFHGDQNVPVWAYRDYVINAFNTNKPFDKFTVEQLAGDLLPNTTVEQKVASGYNRLNMMTREGGAQPKEYLAKYTADRVRTVGMTWMGSTLGCAECHDHKYDPFTAKHFYQMGAFFADIQQWGVYHDYGYTPNPDLRGFSNDHPFPPEMEVESSYLKQRINRLQTRIREVAKQSANAISTTDFEAWRTDSITYLQRNPSGWSVVLNPTLRSYTGGAPHTQHPIESDGSLILKGDKPTEFQLQFKPDSRRVASLKLELEPTARNGTTTLKLTIQVQRSNGKVERVNVRHAWADRYEPQYANGFEIIGIQRGWRLALPKLTGKATSLWLLDQPVNLGDGDNLQVLAEGVPLGTFRLATAPFVPENPNSTQIAESLQASLERADREPERTTALRAHLLGTGWNAEGFATAKRIERDILECRNGKFPTLVSVSVKPMTVRVLARGNWQDETGEIVNPGIPAFLVQGQPSPQGKRLSRLDLANWLTAKDNPLTARVFVNRLWKLFYGNGLSAQVEDYGAQGDYPSHPELLDWLAVEFRDKGWDIKRIVRLMVTSATYRQSSNLRPELLANDPNNRFLASQNPRRLEAEFIRDTALASAGLLVKDMFGPPVMPYQPDGYYAALQFPDRRYIAHNDERQYRRGVYMHWQRTFLHPMLLNFDAPTREDCIAIRTAANTPQQALTLLNDPSMLEAARAFAANLLNEKNSTDAKRIETAYLRTLGRMPKPKEKESLLTFLGKVRNEYQNRPEDAAKLLKVGYAPVPTGLDTLELASWTNVCRVFLNLQETITRY